MAVWPLLRSPRFGYLLNAVALALMVALVVRYQAGHIPRFFTATLTTAALAIMLSVASLLARRSGKSIFDFLLSMAAMALLLMGVSRFTGYLPVGAPAVYQQQTSASAKLYRHSLPGDVELFLDGFDKSVLRSFSDLPRRADEYGRRWQPMLERQGFSRNQARAIGLMLFTSTLWGYGNEKHPDKPGCIPANEDNQWRQQVPDFETVKRARIGCCDDYAHALALVLSRLGFENRYVVLPGHIFNEAKIDGTWHMLDANTNVFITSAWNEVDSRDEVAVHVFPHPGTQNGRLHRPVLAPFQAYVVNMVLLGPLVRGALKEGRPVQGTGQEPSSLYQVLVDASL